MLNLGASLVRRVVVTMVRILMVMMLRESLEAEVVGEGLPQDLAQTHLALLALLSLEPWVLPCVKRFLTILISCMFQTRRFYATSRTWPA